MGPLTPDMKKRAVEQMGDLKYEITWTTLSGYLRELERRGVSQNVASPHAAAGGTTSRAASAPALAPSAASGPGTTAPFEYSSVGSAIAAQLFMQMHHALERPGSR